MDSIRDHINTMDRIEDRLFKERTDDYNYTMMFTPIIIYITLLITLFLIVVSFVKINKDLIRLKLSNAKLVIADESSKMAEIVGNFGSWQYDIEKKNTNFLIMNIAYWAVNPTLLKLTWKTS